jgi:hypothetical protein
VVSCTVTRRNIKRRISRHVYNVRKRSLIVENEEMRRRQTAVCFGDRLRLPIVQIREVESGLDGVFFHVVETVAVLGVAKFIEAKPVGVVGIDRDQRHALALDVVKQFFDPGFGGVRLGTMVG